MAKSSYNEYAIEVEGYGFVRGSEPPFILSVDTEPDVLSTEEAAERLGDKVAHAYRALGVDVIGKVYLRRRVITVKTGKWQ